MNFAKVFALMKKAVVEIFRLSLAGCIIYGLLYIRLIPRVSRDLWEQLNYSQISSLMLRIILVIINIYALILIISEKKRKKKGIIFQKIETLFIKFDEYINFVLKNIYNFFWYMVEKIYGKFIKEECLHYHIVRKLALHFSLKKIFEKYCWFFMAIIFIPKIIFIAAFAYDVFIQQHLHYTFKCIPLLLLPLVENIYIFMLKDFWESHEDSVNSWLDIKKDPDTGENLYRFVSEERPYGAEDLVDYLEYHYSAITGIKEALEIYDWWKYVHFPYFKVSLVLALIRLLGLIYMLFYGIS